MLQILLSRFTWLVTLWLLQVLVFNHVHIFGYATPMPYVYFLILLPSDTSRWIYVAVGFVLGLSVDLFTNTPGMAAASLCLTGLLAPPLLRLFSSAEEEDDSFVPSKNTLEWGAFAGYALSLTLVHCIAFFAIESFSLFDWQMLLFNILGSTALSFIVMIAMELIRSK